MPVRLELKWARAQLQHHYSQTNVFIVYVHLSTHFCVQHFVFNTFQLDFKGPSDTQWNHACETMWTLIQAWQFWAALKSCRSAAMANVASIRFGSAMPDHKNHNASHASLHFHHFHASAIFCTSWSSAFDLKFCSLRLPKIDQRFSMILRFQLVKSEEAFRAFSPMTRLEHFVSRLFICLVYCCSKSPEHQLSVVQDAKSIWFGSTDSHVTMFHFDAFCTGWEGYHPWSRIQKVQHWAESTPELEMFLIDEFLLWHFAIPSFKHTLIVVQLWVSMLVFLAFLHHVDMLWWGQPDRNKPSRCEHRDCCLDCRL